MWSAVTCHRFGFAGGVGRGRGWEFRRRGGDGTVNGKRRHAAALRGVLRKFMVFWLARAVSDRHVLDMSLGSLHWPHAPRHFLAQQGTYFVTAGTYQRRHFFRGGVRLGVLHRGLLSVCKEFGWALEAWAAFSNHYHFVAHSPVGEPTADSLRGMLGKLHGRCASWVNRLDGKPGRKVWFNYWETRLTYERSYLARLGYTHQNAVRHGLVEVANQYPWCSAAWFERTAASAQVQTIYGFKLDRVEVYDDYQPSLEW